MGLGRHCEPQIFRASLRPQKIDMQNTKTRQMQRPDKDKCKDSREDRVAEDRDSEFRIQR